MAPDRFILMAMVPAGILAGFVVHWITLIRVDTAGERLQLSRGAYLGMSVQLVLLAWVSALFLNGGSTSVLLVAVGMTLSFGGDFFNLQFEGTRTRVGEPLFFGIIFFAAAQLCYGAAFLYAVPLSSLIADGYFMPLLAVLVVVPAVLFRLRVYDPGQIGRASCRERV